MKEFRTHCYGCTSMYLRALACLVSEVTQARETRGSQDGEWQSSLTEPTCGNPKKGFIDPRFVGQPSSGQPLSTGHSFSPIYFVEACGSPSHNRFHNADYIIGINQLRMGKSHIEVLKET